MKKIVYLSVISLFIALFQNCTNTSHPEIAQWLGPNRNNIYPEKNLLKEWPKEGPELLWKYENLGLGYATVAVTSEKVYTIATQDSINYVLAFNPQGETLWKQKLGPAYMENFPGSRTTPLIYEGMGYVLSGWGVLYCFDAENGKIIWEKDIMEDAKEYIAEGGFSENLLIVDNKIFCTRGEPHNNILAIDRFNGKILWTNAGNGEMAAYNSPTLIEVNNNKFLITMTCNSLISVDINTGKTAWTYELVDVDNDIHANTPIYKNGYLFFIEGKLGGANMLKITNGGYGMEHIWKNDSVDYALSSAVWIENNIYCPGSSKKEWYCLDEKTGSVKYKTNEFKHGIILAADDLLYIFSNNGQMSLVKPTNTAFELISVCAKTYNLLYFNKLLLISCLNFSYNRLV